jgi:hypothetical protein
MQEEEAKMFEGKKCCVGSKAGGGIIVPHDPDGETQSVRCEMPVVAMEKYGPFDYQVFRVCDKRQHMVHKVFDDLWAD